MVKTKIIKWEYFGFNGIENDYGLVAFKKHQTSKKITVSRKIDVKQYQTILGLQEFGGL